jgi:hypothetical protein
MFEFAVKRVLNLVVNFLGLPEDKVHKEILGVLDRRAELDLKERRALLVVQVQMVPRASPVRQEFKGRTDSHQLE